MPTPAQEVQAAIDALYEAIDATHGACFAEILAKVPHLDHVPGDELEYARGYYAELASLRAEIQQGIDSGDADDSSLEGMLVRAGLADEALHALDQDRARLQAAIMGRARR